MSFPALEDIQTPLPPSEVELLANIYKKEQPNPSVQTRFNLAWALLKSKSQPDQKQGLEMLMSVYADSPSRRRECLFYLALGCYKIGDYTTARKYTDALIAQEPSNQQTQALKKEIERKLNQDGMLGMAILGGAAAVLGTGAAILGTALSKRRR